MKHVAAMAAEMSDKKVVFDLPDEKEKSGYSTATKAILDSDKLKSIGWLDIIDCKEVFKYTINVIRQRISENEV